MKNKKDLNLMWKIFDLINKKHCKNKLKIHRIYFYKKQGNKWLGYYRTLKNNQKSIEIYSESDHLTKVRTLVHELSHAYVDQILKSHFHKDLSKLIVNQPINKYEKDDIKEIISHNKKFRETIKLFAQTLDKNLKIELK